MEIVHLVAIFQDVFHTHRQEIVIYVNMAIKLLMADAAIFKSLHLNAVFKQALMEFVLNVRQGFILKEIHVSKLKDLDVLKVKVFNAQTVLLDIKILMEDV